MASEAVLKELYQVAKNSSSFRGISESEVWKACLAYKDRSDEDIHIAINNIRKKDTEIHAKSQERRNKLIQGKERMKTIQNREADDRQQDAENAEKILEELFKK